VIRPCDTAVDDCLAPGRGRNLRLAGVEQHGATSFLTPQELNDLVAFQNSLSLASVVGTNQPVVSAGTLDLSRVKLVFAKARRRGRDAFSARGVLRSVPAVGDGTEVVLSLATPAGEEMAIVSRALVLRGRGRRLRARSVEGGAVSLALREIGSGAWRLSAKGKRLDLSALNTGNRDLTVAVELGETSFVRNRALRGKKRVFKLPRRRR
jgi:hypothetical protein